MVGLVRKWMVGVIIPKIDLWRKMKKKALSNSYTNFKY